MSRTKRYVESVEKTLDGFNFFLTLDPVDENDRAIFQRWYPIGILMANGHSGALAPFDPALGLPEAQALLGAIHATRPEIEKLEHERQQAIAEATIMRAAADENDNVASVEVFHQQIESREKHGRLLTMKVDTLKRKLQNDQKRLLELMAAESAKRFESELDVVRAEADQINNAIMGAYQQAARLRPRVQRLSELASSCGKGFSPELGYYADGVILEAPHRLAHFELCPGLRMTATAVAFGLRNIRQEGGKKQ